MRHHQTRREGDSNPRLAFDQHAISNRAHSTTLTPLLRAFPRVLMRFIRMQERRFRAAEVRTRDLLHPMQARYQLRYGPFFNKLLNLCIPIRLASFFWILFYGCLRRHSFFVRCVNVAIFTVGIFRRRTLLHLGKYLAAHSKRPVHFNGLLRIWSLVPIVRRYLAGVSQGRFFILYAMFEMKWAMYPIYRGAS